MAQYGQSKPDTTVQFADTLIYLFKWLKDPRLLLCRHPDAGVADRELQEGTVRGMDLDFATNLDVPPAQ